jgi:hypothetical protein
MYQSQAQAAGGAPGTGPDASAGGQPGGGAPGREEEEVVEADYEIVDEEK